MKLIIWLEVVIFAPFLMFIINILRFFHKLNSMAECHAEYGVHLWDIKKMKKIQEDFLTKLKKEMENE